MSSSKAKQLLPHLQDQIETLREANLLSFNNGTTFISPPTTIVLSGNVPHNLITGTNTHRDIFFDAPLEALRED